ncbi:hypothetical protein QZH41_014811, partial [Actinostola sp. cb2023]
CEAAECGQNTTLWEIISIRSPTTYGPNLDCYWILRVSIGNLIKVTFNLFSLEQSAECSKDYVAIHSNSSKTSPLLKPKLCGTPAANQLSVVSETNSLLIHMHSDASGSGSGFFASVEGVCSVTITDKSGYISSPSYPKIYPTNQDCIWLINSGLGYIVTLEFEAFKMETHKDCKFDFLEVRQGTTDKSPLKGLFCAAVAPPKLTTIGPMRIRFKSDSDNEFLGFKAYYTAVDLNECRIPGTCHSNATCKNTIGSYVCTCKISYTGDGKSCIWYKDFNECNMGLHNCHVDANCINTREEFYCRCKTGFLGDGLSCTDTEEEETGAAIKHVTEADHALVLDKIREETAKDEQLQKLSNTVPCKSQRRSRKLYEDTQQD